MNNCIGRIATVLAMAGMVGCEHQLPLCKISKTVTPSGVTAYVDSRRMNRPGGIYPTCDIIFLAKYGEVGNFTIKCDDSTLTVSTIDQASPAMEHVADTIERDYKSEREKGCRSE